MQLVVRPLYLLHPSTELFQRLREAESGGFRLSRGEEWAEVAAALARAPGTAVSIVDPYDPARPDELSAELRALLQRFPAATVIAAFRVEPRHTEELRTLFEWGVADVIALGREDTPMALARRVRAGQARTVHPLLKRGPPRGGASPARLLLTPAGGAGGAGGQAPGIAAAPGGDGGP